MLYKRNQVEEAICRLADPDDSGGHHSKRLLDTDRGLGRDPRTDDRASSIYAFYSGAPSGSGVEVWFEEYEAFALLIALKFLDHGFPQQKSVEVLRRLRSSLETQRFLTLYEARNCRAFPSLRKKFSKSRTGWLGRECTVAATFNKVVNTFAGNR